MPIILVTGSQTVLSTQIKTHWYLTLRKMYRLIVHIFSNILWEILCSFIIKSLKACKICLATTLVSIPTLSLKHPSLFHHYIWLSILTSSMLYACYCNPTLSFTPPPYQTEFTQSYLTNKHILCIILTSNGMSLAFFAAPLLYPHRWFIVIIYLIMLTEDLCWWSSSHFHL